LKDIANKLEEIARNMGNQELCIAIAVSSFLVVQTSAVARHEVLKDFSFSQQISHV
jgi:hypothetical protein